MRESEMCARREANRAVLHQVIEFFDRVPADSIKTVYSVNEDGILIFTIGQEEVHVSYEPARGHFINHPYGSRKISTTYNKASGCFAPGTHRKIALAIVKEIASLF